MVAGYVLYLGLLVGSLVGVGYGLVRVAEGFERWREAAALADVPVASIDAVAVGEAAASGTVRTDEPPTTVPVGGQRCVCYDLTVQDSTDAVPVHEEREHVTFYLSDGTGRIRVDPSAFRLDLTDERTGSVEVKSYDEPSDRVASFAADRDLPDQGMRRDRTFEYAYVQPGDEVYAYGRVRVDPEREADADEKAVVLVGDGGGFLSNKPRERLRRERRFALARSVGVGVLVGTASLAAFLWLSGIAQLFLEV